MKKFLHLFPTPRFLKFSYVGFEISSNCVRYAEICDSGRGLGLARHGEKKIDVSDDIFSNQSLKNALKEIASKEKITHIKATLPEEFTYLFTLPVQGDSEKEIRSSIEFHLEENVPLSVSDALFDFYLLPEVNGQKTAVVSVVSSNIVEKYISLFKENGLTPVAFMVESSSLSRTVIPKDDFGTYMIVYLSERKTVFSVVSQGYVQFSSTLSLGGSIMTDALSKYFKISEDEAKKMKMEKGFSNDNTDSELMSALANTVAVLRDEIQRVLSYWYSHSSNSNKDSIKKIILVGSDASIPGFAEYLSLTLKTPAVLGNVWENVFRYKTDVPPIKFNDSLSFGACIGLSLTSV